MQPIGFEVLRVPEQVYNRYARHNIWWRHPPALLVLGIISVLLVVAFFVATIRSEDEFLGSEYYWGFCVIVMLAAIPGRLYWRNSRFLVTRCEYIFWENDVVVRTHETYQSWRYTALAYAREAKDAFYLVLDAQANQAMIIPKEALSPEQCAALVETLQRGVPEGKFTRWKGAG